MVHFYVTATAQTEWCCLTSFYPGDGTSVLATLDHPCPAPLPSRYTKTFDHMYTVPGTFTVEVQPSSAQMCNGIPQITNATLFIPLTVASAA